MRPAFPGVMVCGELIFSRIAESHSSAASEFCAQENHLQIDENAFRTNLTLTQRSSLALVAITGFCETRSSRTGETRCDYAERRSSLLRSAGSFNSPSPIFIGGGCAV